MKKPRLPKADKEPKTPKSADAVPGHNLVIVDPEKRELFLADLRKWEKLDKAVKDATAKRTAHQKQIKDDGFLMEQIKLGAKVQTPEGEAEVRAKITSQLIAAQYVGSVLGQQLHLFLEPDRTPSADLAFDQGVKDALDNKAARPPYDPSTEQASKYLDGFHSITADMVKKGIKSLSEMN